MKKALPYLIAAVIVILLVILITTSKRRHEFDDRITFRKTDKIPYGTYVAFQSLPSIFPSSKIAVNHSAPGSSPEINVFGQNQALIIITPQFLPDQDEMSELIDFAKKGNEVFISAKRISRPAQELLRCNVISPSFGLVTMAGDFDDSLEVKLDFKPQIPEQDFFYPGYRFDSYFQNYDSLVANQFGYAISNKETGNFLPDFMALTAGNGHIYLHLAPICFSNYFLLYHKNIDYYNKVLSVIPENENKIVWDEYYLRKYYYSDSSGRKKSENDILSGLMSHPAFRAAVWLIIIVLSLYLLQEVRRNQRYIVEMPKPRNDSMEFVRTIGRLYYEKADHKNLGRKMSAYFLEHVRNRYKLPTAQLDENFIKNLQMKSGQPENNIREIVSFIQEVEQSPEISARQLAEFHKSLEDFYQQA